MDNLFSQYAQTIQRTLEMITQETEAFEQGASLIAGAVERDELVHVIGPGGHSNMAVEEVLWRAGGLAPVNAILDAGTNVIHGAKRSNIIERCPGYGIRVMDAYGLNRAGEVLVIVNAYGINAMTIDVATEARSRGIKTIGITSDSPPVRRPGTPAGKICLSRWTYTSITIYPKATRRWCSQGWTSPWVPCPPFATASPSTA